MTMQITYAHKECPDGQRFRQYTKDNLPDWAVDVREEPNNALSYAFDLFYDIKTTEELEVELEYLQERLTGLLSLCHEHNLKHYEVVIKELK